MVKLISTDISWKYQQIVSSENCTKHSFKTEWSLVAFILKWRKLRKSIVCFDLYRYNAIISRPDLKKIHNDDNLRTQILSICESFIGCVQGKIFLVNDFFKNLQFVFTLLLIKFLSGTHMTTSGQLFNYLQPVMNTMIDMMGLYHNYPNIVELFLEIYCEAAKRMLCYLTTSASRHLYQQTINLIQVYAHHNQVMVCLPIHS